MFAGLRSHSRLLTMFRCKTYQVLLDLVARLPMKPQEAGQLDSKQVIAKKLETRLFQFISRKYVGMARF